MSIISDSNAENENSSNKEWGWYVANGLTLMRSAIALATAIRIAESSDNIDETTGIAFILGLATDVLDGRVAEMTDQDSKEGGLRDRLADIGFYSLPTIALGKIVSEYGDVDHLITLGVILSSYYLFFILRASKRYNEIFRSSELESSKVGDS